MEELPPGYLHCPSGSPSDYATTLIEWAIESSVMNAADATIYLVNGSQTTLMGASGYRKYLPQDLIRPQVVVIFQYPDLVEW
jgi:hypothetical protein